MGELLSAHVIPRPADEVEPILLQRRGVTPKSAEEVVQHPTPRIVRPEPALPVPDPASGDDYLQQLNAMTVHQLRTVARGIEGLGIQGREICRANKQILIQEIMRNRT